MDDAPRTITVTRHGRKGRKGVLDARYVLAFSRLPGREFGPYGYGEARGQIEVSALLDPAAARDLLITAWAEGTATTATGQA